MYAPGWELTGACRHQGSPVPLHCVPRTPAEWHQVPPVSPKVTAQCQTIGNMEKPRMKNSECPTGQPNGNTRNEVDTMGPLGLA